MKRILPALAAAALAAAVPSAAFAEKTAPVRVATWKGDAMGAVSLYYDDGTGSSFRNALPELVRRGLAGTFYICGGWFGSEDDPNLVRWGTAAKEHPKSVFLGDHTWAHGGVTNAAQFAEEIARNGALLRRLAGLPEDEPLSFALPGAVRWDVTPEEQAKVLADHHEVLRHPFEPNIAGPKDGNNPTFSMRTAADAAEAFDRAEKDGGWESLIFHGIGGDWIAFDLEEHGRMLDELEARVKAGRLWCGSAIDVHRYAAARDAIRFTDVEVSEDGL
ncbi:MAG: polysaccharide deacetylase family protein, partial [Kiritimatiellae bacterium]|nr:polysaccharide deacetylase family protein [Kiritimatiellia bacterium]